MPIPSPAERPDLYDDYDCRPGGPRHGEKEYWDSVVPEYIKRLLDAKQRDNDERVDVCFKEELKAKLTASGNNE